MGAEWYVNVTGQIKGPFTSDQLKRFALQNSISPRTGVRKGTDGRWVQADRIKGLSFDKAAQGGEQTEDAVRTQVTPEAAVTGAEFTVLSPHRRITPRVIALGCLIVFALIGTAGAFQKAFFCGSMALLLGTFPRYRVNRQELQCEFVLMFCPVHTKSWPFNRFEAIETDLDFQLPFWTIIFFGWNWLMVKFLDFIVPWMGGSYMIWLRTWKRDRVLAWQGNGDTDFQSNLETLQRVTGLPIERR